MTLLHLPKHPPSHTAQSSHPCALDTSLSLPTSLLKATSTSWPPVSYSEQPSFSFHANPLPPLKHSSGPISPGNPSSLSALATMP